MDADLAMAIGLVLGVFSVPSLLSALSEARTPRVGALVLVIAGGMIIWAISQKPGGYTFAELPAVILNVMARYLP
ncbi:hypothetical protein C6W92_13075 [Roseovarius sp. A46]|uniref:hypothetical protein n=1 Tax=Roseovarius sp. A46 TaxID=2109331 RepID=UPI0010119B73|nr:hypothetical protein [Roseovarius sp. A46]RXV60810.1 hypothetical protein C6W92_13075 [Roseovarius sp. A46]